MSDHLPTVNRIKALDMMRHLPSSDGMSPEDKTALEDALEQDLDTASHQAMDDQERLQKLEGQVHALSDAIIVIAEPSASIDDAVRTVKDKM